MRVLILGAGQVGSTLAANLTREDISITIIDRDPQRLAVLKDRFDLRSIQGHAAHPAVLERAGAQDADMVVAVTNSDEVNMVACQVAHSLYHVPTKLARVRAWEYLQTPELFDVQHCPVDVLISPEQLVTEHLKRLIEYPGALQVLDFADGRAQLIAVRVEPDSLAEGHAIRDLNALLVEHGEVRVPAIFRREGTLIPDGDTMIEARDTLFVLCARKDARDILRRLAGEEKPVQRVTLAGGGNIGASLAKALEDDYHVKLIERNDLRAEAIAEELEETIVLVGDCADEDLLSEENIYQTDVYCALTNDDEANILSSMLAKRLGAQKVITLITRPAYADMVESGLVDIAVSPQQITTGALLTHVRRGHMVRIHSLKRGAAEAIEAVAHGDPHSSRVVGRALDDIDLPRGASIGGIVRGDDLLMAHHDLVVEPEDHVIVFVGDKRHIPEIEKLFQVSVTFI